MRHANVDAISSKMNMASIGLDKVIELVNKSVLNKET